MVFVCPGIYPRLCFGIYLAICLEIYLVGKNIKKESWSPGNSRLAHLLKVVGLTKIPRDHETLSIVRLVALHVDISSMKSSLDL